MIVPFGTYKVEFKRVFLLKVDELILNGFVISEITIGKSNHENASSPILVTLFGMVTEVRLEQPLNASSPILVTLFGMVIEVRLAQLLNALIPILVTLFGMVMEVRLAQL